MEQEKGIGYVSDPGNAFLKLQYLKQESAIYDKAALESSVVAKIKWVLTNGHSPVFRIWAFVMFLINVFSACLFVWETYRGQTRATLAIDFATAVLCIINMSIRIVASPVWYFAIFPNWETLFDVVTIVPMLVAIADPTSDVVASSVSLGSASSASVVYIEQYDYTQLNFMRVLYAVLVWDAFHSQWPLNKIRDFEYELAKVLYMIICLPLVCAGFFYVVMHNPDDYPNLKYWDCVYWGFVTLSTVGYGDYSSRKNELGMFVCVASIGVALSLVPLKVSSLSALLGKQPKFAGTMGKTKKHVVVTSEGSNGPLHFDLLADFLSEFYHEENDNQDCDTLVMSPEDPPPALLELLHSESFYKKRVTFLCGSLLNVSDMERARITSPSCLGVFILTEADYEEDFDDSTILAALAIRKFCTTRIFLSLKSKWSLAKIPEGSNIEAIHSITGLQKSLVGYSAICPGFSTLVHNLFVTSGDSDVDETKPWLVEYLHGTSYEVYRFKVPEVLARKSFPEVVKYLYLNYQILLFGAIVTMKSSDGYHRTKVILNPGKSLLLEKGQLCFVLATDPDQVKEVLRVLKSGQAEEKYMPNEATDTGPRISMASVSEGGIIADALKRCDLNSSDIGGWMPSFSSIDIASAVLTQTAEMISTDTFLIEEQLEGVIDMSGHIVICSPCAEWVTEVIMSIRNRSVQTPPPIVVLCPVPISAPTHKSDCFTNVSYVKGTATNPIDLVRVNIKSASTVLVLPDLRSSGLSADSLGILAKQFIDEELAHSDLSTRPNVIVELAFVSNIKYFAQDNESFKENALVAEGSIINGESIRSFVVKQYFGEHYFPLFESFIPTSTYLPGDEASGVVINIPLPASIRKKITDGEDQSWANVVTLCCDKGYVPMALYRKAGSASKANNCAYVYTNPPPSAPLLVTDNMLVISSPTVSNLDEDDEATAAMAKQKHAGKGKDKKDKAKAQSGSDSASSEHKRKHKHQHKSSSSSSKGKDKS